MNKNLGIENYEQPLVSILLVSMNHEPYVEKCISSLFSQTYQNFEILYLDNNSIDATFEKAEKLLMSGVIPFKALKLVEPKGISVNLNQLLHMSSGQFVIALSTDDWLTDNSIEEKVNYFIEYPQVALVYSNSVYFFYDKGAGNICIGKDKFKSGWILDEILTKDIYCTTGAMIDSSVLKQLGGYDEMSNIEDWDIWIRIAEKHPFGYINKELAFYGIKSSMNVSGNNHYMQEGYKYLFKKYAHYPQIEIAKLKSERYLIYSLASNEPSLKTLKYILLNSKFDFFSIKQIVKVVLGMIKIK